jgi:hypothetical protein
MDWRFIRWAILSVLAIIIGFVVGCISVGWLTMNWATKTAPHDGQDGLAVFIFGLGGGLVFALA